MTKTYSQQFSKFLQNGYFIKINRFASTSAKVSDITGLHNTDFDSSGNPIELNVLQVYVSIPTALEYFFFFFALRVS